MNPPARDFPRRLSHLLPSQLTRDDVYEPSDDTYLLVDTLHHFAPLLTSASPEELLFTCEIGSGSGVVSAALLEATRPSARVFHVATDINIKACETTRTTLTRNDYEGSSDETACNLIDALRPGLCNLLVFNPPYVPTEAVEVVRTTEAVAHLSAGGGSSIAAATWAGGSSGREVLDELIPKLDAFMARDAVVFFVAVEENDPDAIALALKTHGGFQARRVTARKAYNERLVVIMGTRGRFVGV